MKKIILALFSAAALLGAGCAKINFAEGQLEIPDGEMLVDLGFTGPEDIGTRSYVSGTEEAISSIAMLCFDGEGKFITERDATVTPSTTNPNTKGTLTGTVPANTCRIHFVANFAGLDLSSFGMGTLERTMMKSKALSSGISDKVRFWGYRTESSASAMKTWLSGGNTVMLLRDRAKVVLVKNLNSDADAITEMKWTVGNGVIRGFVAPTTASGNNPYTNDYTTSTRLTEFTSSGRYATMEDTEAIWAGENEPQFLFENANTTGNPAKIIIYAKYGDGTEKYHTVLLQSNENVPYPVVRNQTFTLTVKNLPKSRGAGSLADALTSTDYSNNPYAQVAREVDEVNNEGYTLKVESVTKMFHENGDGVIGFTYTAHGDGDISDLTSANFDVSWEAKSESDETLDVVDEVSGELATPTVEFDNTTGEGTITFPLATVSGTLKHNTLQIVALNSGLARYVDVYSVTSFSYATAPQLFDNHTTRTSGGETREVYKLTFTLPDLPASQYPLHVKMYTSTLSPFSDNGPSATSGSFNVVVADTKNIAPTEPAQSSVWNYGFKSWGQYYEYVIDQKPSSPEGNSYTIYLNDIIANYSRTINSVGLYFHIDGFGDPIPLQAQAISKVTQTFQPANFSFQQNTLTASLGEVSITLGNSSRPNSNNYLNIGRDSGDGTVTVTANSGYVITKIEISYYYSNYYDYYYIGGDVTASTGRYSKSETTGTWIGDPAQSVKLTMALDYYYESPLIKSIKVTYQTAQGS